MTEEHAFIEWKAEQYKHQSTEEELEFVEHLHNFPRYFKKTFLAGYHECQKEHDSQKTYKELCENYSSNKSLYTDGYSDGYKECQKEHEWHYVKDGLPTNTGLYLIFYYNSFFNDKVRCIARYSPDRKEFLNLNIEDGDEVIAWQELPVPPKENE